MRASTIYAGRVSPGAGAFVKKFKRGRRSPLGFWLPQGARTGVSASPNQPVGRLLFGTCSFLMRSLVDTPKPHRKLRIVLKVCIALPSCGITYHDRRATNFPSAQPYHSPDRKVDARESFHNAQACSNAGRFQAAWLI